MEQTFVIEIPLSMLSSFITLHPLSFSRMHRFIKIIVSTCGVLDEHALGMFRPCVPNDYIHAARTVICCQMTAYHVKAF